MKILKQIAILFSICCISLCIEKILPIPFPASVIGMILLLILLFTKRIRLESIKETSSLLLQSLPLLFIPADVNIVNYFDVIWANFGPLMVVCVVSLFITFAATAYAVQLTMKLMEKRKEKENSYGTDE